MCIQMTDSRWLELSQEEDPEYILKETRYNADGQAARVYSDPDDDSYPYLYAVFPGIDNSEHFSARRTTMAQVIAYIFAAGYTLSEDPTSTPAPVPVATDAVPALV